MNSLRPSAKVMSRPFALFEPSFARYPSTNTSEPIGRSRLVKPRRSRLVGGPPSTIQATTVPSSCVTSTCSHEWGFTHSILVIVPRRETGLFASNSAANA